MSKKISRLRWLVSTTRNFYCPILVYLGIIRRCTAKLSDGSTFDVTKETWYNYYRRVKALYLMKKARNLIKKMGLKTAKTPLLEFNFKGRRLRFKVPEISDRPLKSVRAVFYKETYRFLDVKDKVVIDVGAWVGDSSVYFALKGAKKVIAMEPHPLLI
ncbi:MAG TPA: hypothetical protein ENF53_03775 [Thermoprotei archaeon]|nr:hypothetical protein [Thermoprotei archaeon]